MEVIILLVLASLTVSTVFLLAFLWATRSGQYDDVVTPGLRMLVDDVAQAQSEKPSTTT